MIEALLAAPGASAAALAALGFLAACPLMRSRRPLLACQFGAGCAFASHYALLGIDAASAICGLGAAQAGAALFAERLRALDRIGWALIPCMVGAALWFWAGPISLLAAAAMAMVATARMQSEEARLRALLVAGSALRAAHDAMAASWIAFAADLLAGALGAQALARLRRAGASRGMAFA